MTDEMNRRLLSDQSILGYEVGDTAERISHRRMFSDLSRADREDLMGTAIDKYYAKWGRLGRPDSVEAWLSTVMHRAMVDLFHGRRRLFPVGGDEKSVDRLLEQWVPPAPSMSTRVANRVAHQSFLADLPPGDARLLCLKADGYSRREIGEILRIRPNTVDVRLHRLRARLKTLLAEDDHAAHGMWSYRKDSTAS